MLSVLAKHLAAVAVIFVLAEKYHRINYR